VKPARRASGGAAARIPVSQPVGVDMPGSKSGDARSIPQSGSGDARSIPLSGSGAAASVRGARGAVTRLVLLPIRLYQRAISPALPRRCKYHPTCSQYAVQAIGSYGILRGAVLAGWRLLRCNPWSHGGYDPVSAQMLFRRSARSSRLSASDS
jgi:uncharacterized protein